MLSETVFLIFILLVFRALGFYFQNLIRIHCETSGQYSCT
jgi:hypothetical protein